MKVQAKNSRNEIASFEFGFVPSNNKYAILGADFFKRSVDIEAINANQIHWKSQQLAEIQVGLVSKPALLFFFQELVDLAKAAEYFQLKSVVRWLDSIIR